MSSFVPAQNVIYFFVSRFVEIMDWWIDEYFMCYERKNIKSWKKKISKIIFLAIQLHDQWYDMKVTRYVLISFIDSKNFRIFSYFIINLLVWFCICVCISEYIYIIPVPLPLNIAMVYMSNKCFWYRMLNWKQFR